jgi:hypothetical protein
MRRVIDTPFAKRFDGEVFLTETQLAARHQRSVKTLRNARVSGGYIQFVKIGRNVRYRLSDVLAFEQAAFVGASAAGKTVLGAVAASVTGHHESRSIWTFPGAAWKSTWSRATRLEQSLTTRKSILASI